MDTTDLEMFEENFKRSELDKLKATYVNTQYSLWNSLITFNAIVLSVISVLRILDSNISKSLVSWLLITCSFSIVLIITNYYMSKSIYYFLSNKEQRKKSNTGNKTTDNNNKGTYKFKVQHLQFFFEIIVAVLILINLFKIVFWVIIFV